MKFKYYDNNQQHKLIFECSAVVIAAADTQYNVAIKKAAPTDKWRESPAIAVTVEPE